MRQPTRILSSLLPVLLAFLFAPVPSIAQSFQAQITGVVRDSAGAVIPGAELQATNKATGVRSTAATNGEGIYRFPALPPGNYSVSAKVPGFKVFEQTTLTLQVNQVLELNVTLDPGDVSEQITVTAEPPPLETDTSTLGQVVTTRTVENMPLSVRDPMALLSLTPGVTFGGSFGNGLSAGRDVGRNFFRSDFNIGGGRSGSQEILLDGVPNTTGDVNRAVINPPVDAVQEFKVQMNSYDAQFGRTSGGVVNVITRSGTNEFHGTAYAFERHSVLDANNFFNNRNNQPLTSFARHQFGGALGGPILKNKWFFFGDYEGLRQGYPLATITSVPTALQRQGDFSQTFASNGQRITIYDPLTTQVLPDGTRTRSPFPGNIIPWERFDRVAANTIGYFPTPNLPGNAITGQNNYYYSAKSTSATDKYDIRSDWSLSESTRMFARYSRQDDLRMVPGNMPLPIGGGAEIADVYSQAVASITHVLSPSTVVDAQASFSRALAQQYGQSRGFDLGKLGFTEPFTRVQAPQFPNFGITDMTSTASGGSAVSFQPRNTFATRGTVGYLRGRHNFRFGADVRKFQFNEGQNATAAGTFSFGRQFTQGPNPVQASVVGGHGFASFLLGAASSGSALQIAPISTRGSYYALFIQDDWRVTDRLTLNLGLRWDGNPGMTEKYDRLAFFDENATSPLAQMAGMPNLRGAIGWVGGGNTRYQQQSDWSNFGPRIGFAWNVATDTVVRGGYGMFFLPRSIQGYGYGALEGFRTTTMVASVDGLTPLNYLSNPFPEGIFLPGNTRNPLVNAGAALTVPTRDYNTGYSQTWSMGVQRALPGKLVVSGNYYGNKGTGLLVSWNINQLPVEYLSLGTRLNDQVANPFFGLGSEGILANRTISRQQSLLPFPQYTSILRNYIPAGNSTYHAGTLQVERRMAAGLTFLAAYTRSKSIDDVRTPLDFYNRRLEKALSPFDTPNQIIASGVFELPFGRGRAFGRDLGGVPNAILGGWNLSGILRVQSGLPVSIGRPSVNNGRSAKLDEPTIERWFDTSVFSVAPAFTFGNLGPVLPDVRTDGIRNVDAVLAKTFPFTVRDREVSLQFRSEFYNLFNSVQFGSPVGSVSSQTFGQVTTQANNPRSLQFGLKLRF